MKSQNDLSITKSLIRQPTFIMCWIAYALAYFCRVNFSIALPLINIEFQSQAAKTGVIASCFFFSYAVGQLINGFAGDHVKPERMVFGGLLLSACANLAFGFANSVELMSGIWLLNGFFQSMLWGPIIKILSANREKHGFHKISSRLMLSTVAGYFLAWGVAGFLGDHFGWRYALWTPALTCGVFSFVWVLVMRRHQYSCPEVGLNDEKNEPALCSPLKVISRAKLWFVMGASLCQGIIKDGISLLVPLYFLRKYQLSLSHTIVFILAIPIFNALGVIFTGWLNKKLHYQERKTASFLFIFALVLLILLISVPLSNIIFASILIACISGMIYGANSIILSTIPLKCSQYGKSSLVAGIMDFCAYMGTAISSLILGAVIAQGHIDILPLSWLLAAVLGAAFMAVSRRKQPWLTRKRELL